MNKLKHVIGMMLLLTVLATTSLHGEAFTNQDIVVSSYGDNLIELQARLQYLGFYHGEIDGHFGSGTEQALKKFQKQFGLPTDGVTGNNTRSKLEGFADYSVKGGYLLTTLLGKEIVRSTAMLRTQS